MSNLKIVQDPTGLELRPAGAVLWNRRCLWCSGTMIAPRRGPLPLTCSARCRQALHRHHKKQIAKGVTPNAGAPQ